MGGACFSIHALGPKDQLLVTSLTGKTTIDGPGIKVIPPLKIGKIRRVDILEPGEYCVVKTTTTGALRRIDGPKQVRLGPYDVVLKPKRKAITLEANEYIRLVDDVTGKIRLETGEAIVYPHPTEKLLEGGKKRGVAIDPETAVLVRSRTTGNLSLRTEHGMYFPSIDEDIVKVQKLITLAEYQTMIIEDRFGQYHFVSGAIQAQPLSSKQHTANTSLNDIVTYENIETKDDDDEAERKVGTGKIKSVVTGTVAHTAIHSAGVSDCALQLNRSANGQDGGVSFFLPPYCKIVELVWSAGVKKEKKDGKGRKMTVFDSRPWYMNYEFVVRTHDNVELLLSISFFWSLENIAFMIRNTDDAPGDICHHARSEIIQAVSKVTLKEFMENFNQIVHQTILESNDPFYEERGSKIHSVEVRSFECLDKKIDSVLQEIIKESTDRINRLQLVESENEVALEKMKGRIEEEKIKGQLIDVKNEHQRKEALIDGEAEAERVAAFIKGLNNVCGPDQAIVIFNELRKAEVMTALANSDAHLYFTPAECDLRLGMNTVQDARGGSRKNKITNKHEETSQMKRNSLYKKKREESKISASSLINR
jgi:hypothetical protein